MSYRLENGREIPGVHPDAVREAAGVLEYHGGSLGPYDQDAMAAAIAAYLGWMERYQQDDAAAARRQAQHRVLVHMAGKRR